MKNTYILYMDVEISHDKLVLANTLTLENVLIKLSLFIW